MKGNHEIIEILSNFFAKFLLYISLTTDDNKWFDFLNILQLKHKFDHLLLINIRVEWKACCEHIGRPVVGNGTYKLKFRIRG